MDLPEEIVAIVAIICVFGFVPLTFGLIVYAHTRSAKMRHEERLELIKSGRDLPIEWNKTSKPKNRAFFWGVVSTGFGAGLQVLQGFTFFADLFKGRLFRYHGADDYFFGLIFLGIGASLIYYHKYQQKHPNNNVPIPQKSEAAADQTNQISEAPQTNGES